MNVQDMAHYTPSSTTVDVVVYATVDGRTAVMVASGAIAEAKRLGMTLEALCEHKGYSGDIVDRLATYHGIQPARVVVRGNLTRYGRWHTIALVDGTRHTVLLPGS